MATKKKLASIPVDPENSEAMQNYAATYGLSMPDLVGRMWALWQTIDKTRDGLMPTYEPPLHEDLNAFLDEMDGAGY